MASYQDIDIRLKVVEDKVDFLLTSVNVEMHGEREEKGPGGEMVRVPVSLRGNLLDVYRRRNYLAPERAEKS